MVDASKVAKYMPSVDKPTYKQPFNARIKWTGVALVLYFILSSVTIYGLSDTNFERYRFFEIVLGSKFGSLMTLGIGPIVTAGILLQLLVGSKILNWDTKEEEGRKKFNSWNKVLGVTLCFVEAFIFVFTKAVPVDAGVVPFVAVILQLAAGGIITILLDEMVSKWGFGSGISLFIAAGVASQILIRLFSPFTSACVPGNIGSCLPTAGSLPSGIFWNFLISVFAANTYQALVYFAPIIATAVVFCLVVYAQDISVDIPLSFAALRGFGRSWSLKLFYTSNIPVILTAALVANMQLFGQIGATAVAGGGHCSIIGCFDSQGSAVSGIIYYLTSPKSLITDIIGGTITSYEILRALTYMLFMASLATVFSVFWVGTSGMDSASVAEQIDSVGMQIPGYRRDKSVIKSVLDRYIPALAVVGGFCIGVLAAFADFTGAIGTGTGMLLTVMIAYNYYEELRSQRLEEAHPLIRGVFGE
jgi:preprotein translocase subunit SecY